MNLLHSGLFREDLNGKRSEELLRKDLRFVVSLITGHRPLKKHICTIGLASNSTSRMCLVDDEILRSTFCGPVRYLLASGKNTWTFKLWNHVMFEMYIEVVSWALLATIGIAHNGPQKAPVCSSIYDRFVHIANRKFKKS